MPTVTVIQPTIAAEQNQKIRCAAYCRVSSNSEDQINSFIAQTRYYEKAFENSETEQLVDIYADEGITGTREDKRDEFQRMISDCRKGKIDRIYTKSISRFARNTRDCLKNVRELKSLGITIFFEKENIDTANMTDEMMITIMGGLAQEESVSISKNLKWSYQKRMKAGEYITSCAPFGYVLSDRQLYVNEDEAKIVRDIFNYVLCGHGIQSTVDYANKKYPIKKWTHAGIAYMLTNEKYIGDSMLQKYYTPDIVGSHCRENKGGADKYYYEHTHQAIISTESFQAVQSLLQSRRVNRRPITEYPLSKKMKCSNCKCHFKRRVNRGVVYWICVNHNINSDRCSIRQIPEKNVYSAFIRLYNKLLFNYKQILVPLQTSLQDLKLKKFNGKTQVMDIHKEIAKLREQTHVLARLKTKGFLDEAKYIEQTTELTAKINKLQAELKKLTRLDDEDETLDQIEMLIDFFERRDKPITEFEESAFESIVEKIVVIDQHELEFHLIGGIKFKENI